MPKKKTYNVEFKADDQLSPYLENIDVAFEQLTVTVSKSSDSVDEFGKKLKGIGGFDLKGAFEKGSQGLDSLVAGFSNVSNAVLAFDAVLAASAVALLNYSSDGVKAIDTLRGALGLPAEEVEKFGDIAKSVYSDLLVDSVTEGAEIVRKTIETLGTDSEEEINRVSRAALNLRDYFGADVSQSIDAIKTLMDNFGLSSQQAIDYITTGFREGLNRSEDFLDTITEYSVQFDNGAGSIQEFFSILDSGLQGGILGSDKAADAFKEFSVRIQDGSKTTKESLEAIGISYDQFQKDIGSGAISTAEAFQIVINQLNETTDSATQFQAGVGLLGTQFEDLGAKGALSLDTLSSKFANVEGAAESLSEKQLSAAQQFEKTYRSVLQTVTDSDIFKAFESQISEFFAGFGENFAQAFDKIDTSEIEGKLKNLFSAIAGDLSALFGDVDLTTIEGLETALQKIVDTIGGIIDFTTGLAEAWEPVIRTIGEAIDFFNDLDDSTKKLLGTIGGISQQMALFGTSVVGVNVALKALSGQSLKNLATSLAGSSKGIVSFIGSKASLLGLLGVSAAAGFALGSLLRLIPGVDEFTQKLIEIIDLGAEADFSIGEDVDTIRYKGEAMLYYRRNIEEAAKSSDELQRKQKAALGTVTDFREQLETLAELDKFAPDVDLSKVTESTKFIKDEFGRLKLSPKVEPVLDEESVKELKSDVKEELTEIEKTKLNIQSKLDVTALKTESDEFIEYMKQTGETAREQLKIDAEFNSQKAQIEAEKFFSLMEGGSELISDLGATAADLFDQFDPDLDFQTMWKLQETLQQQLDIQRERADIEIELLELQAEKTRLENAALRDPQKAMLEVTVDKSFEPALELVLRNLLMKTRIWGTEYDFATIMEAPF